MGSSLYVKKFLYLSSFWALIKVCGRCGGDGTGIVEYFEAALQNNGGQKFSVLRRWLTVDGTCVV